MVKKQFFDRETRLKNININENVKMFIKDRHPDSRYASFDYCFNYFRSLCENGEISKVADNEHLQISCMHLGGYLASWGMYRGSSFLLRDTSVRHYRNIISELPHLNPKLWSIDGDMYGDEGIIQLLLDTVADIGKLLKKGDSEPSKILITKTMLGIFGNVPAFDRFFQKGLGVCTCNKDAFSKIYDFYCYHKTAIDSKKI